MTLPEVVTKIAALRVIVGVKSPLQVIVVGSFFRTLGWLLYSNLYSGVGADTVMESITLIDPAVGF